MTHNLALFRPTRNSYTETDTPANALALIIAAVPSFAHLFLWGIGPFGLLTFVIAPIIAGIIFILGTTHQEKSMDLPERNLWDKYNRLDPEVKAKIALDIPTIKKIGDDEPQFWELDREIDNLLDKQQRRKRAEARLDPTAIVVLESVKQAQVEEEQYEHEIRKVLGDFERAETAEERLRLADKIRKQLTRH